MGWNITLRWTALLTRLRQRSSTARLAAWPIISSAHRARVMPTLMRRSSATKPMDRWCTPAVLTQLKMTTSFSRPCPFKLGAATVEQWLRLCQPTVDNKKRRTAPGTAPLKPAESHQQQQCNSRTWCLLQLQLQALLLSGFAQLHAQTRGPYRQTKAVTSAALNVYVRMAV